MPTVPQATPSVQSRPLDPGYQNASSASLDAFGALQGAGLAQTGARLQGVADEFGRLALKAQMEDNEREAKKLDIELSSTLRAINYGDGTAQNPGYFGLKGEAALQGYGNAQKAVQEAHKKLAEGAKNDRVKQMFGEVAARRVESELNTMARFVGQERVRAADTVSEARLSEAANDAARAWNNPTIIQRSVGLAVNEIKDMAQRNGWGPEVEAAKVREATSVIATGAAKAALAVEATGAAQRIFKQYESSFSPEARASISKQIRDGSVQHSAQALRDQAIALHPGDLEKQAEFIRQRASGKVEDAALSSITTWHSIQRASEADRERAQNKALRGESQKEFDAIVKAHPLSLNDQIDEARKLPPEMRDAVESRLRAEDSYRRQEAADRFAVGAEAERKARMAEAQRLAAEKEQNKQAYKTGDELISQGGSLDALSPELRSLLTPEQRKALETYEERRAKGMEFPKVSDGVKLNEYLQMPPDELSSVSQSELKTHLSRDDYTVVERLRQQSLQGKRDPSNPYSIQSRVRQKTMDLLGPADTDAKKSRHARIQTIVEEELELERRVTKKPVTAAREKEIIDGAFDKVLMPGWFGRQVEAPVYDAVKDIPEADRKQITSAFKARFGSPPTMMQMLQLYREKLARDKEQKR